MARDYRSRKRYRLWPKRDKPRFVKAINRIFLWIWGRGEGGTVRYNAIYWWGRRQPFGRGLLMVAESVVMTLAGEPDGFGEWRKRLYCSWLSWRCRECGYLPPSTDNRFSKMHFHHILPLALIRRAICSSFLRYFIPRWILVVLANIVANSIFNMRLLCVEHHIEVHEWWRSRGFLRRVPELLKSQSRKAEKLRRV